MNKLLPLSLLAAFGLASCGADKPAAATTPAAASPAAAKFVLAADPGEALGVVDAKLAGPADKVTVEGRIANIVKGFAVFTLMDKALPYCGETNKEDKCKTPWDYCCEDQKTRTANSMVVEFHDASGQPIATASLPSLQLVDAVKVTGKLTKDADGNFVLAATGVFRTEHPTLPDYVKVPN
jgi:hypothetical protein